MPDKCQMDIYENGAVVAWLSGQSVVIEAIVLHLVIEHDFKKRGGKK